MTDVYTPPIDHIRFVLTHLVDTETVAKLAGFEHADVDTTIGLLEEFGRFCAAEVAPLNRVGDTIGASYDPATGQVRTPPGWHAAYAKYVEAGWCAVPFPAEYGGGEFPWLLAVAMQELLTASNMAFGLSPMLTQGAIELLVTHASTDQKSRYLPLMVSGAWTAAMAITEPQAGTDLGAITTKAVPGPDGSWRITGTKIFISYGQHDLTDNIVHLVLARVPGAPAGSKGISCFIVPARLDDGSKNTLGCIGIEHKMGIHGSPTCTMQYDGAVGWPVGDELNNGMAQMFTMMNHARLGVGLSGLAVAERAYQAAVSYARERVQGRPVGSPPGTITPIIEHPDVRRMLLHVRSHIEAMRALVYTTAWAIDMARHGRDPIEAQAGQELADLLTPITKAWCSDLGSELTRICTQIHGGTGYITETGAEQHERDIRIAAIYEGANGIQAVDLVTRKLPLRAGAVVIDLITTINLTADHVGGSIGTNLRRATEALGAATERLLAEQTHDRRSALAGATPYLRLFGTVLGGWFLARQAGAAPDDPERQATALYYCEQILPTAPGLLAAVTSSADVLYAIPSDRM